MIQETPEIQCSLSIETHDIHMIKYALEIQCSLCKEARDIHMMQYTPEIKRSNRTSYQISFIPDISLSVI